MYADRQLARSRRSSCSLAMFSLKATARRSIFPWRLCSACQPSWETWLHDIRKLRDCTRSAVRWLNNHALYCLIIRKLVSLSSIRIQCLLDWSRKYNNQLHQQPILHSSTVRCQICSIQVVLPTTSTPSRCKATRIKEQVLQFPRQNQDQQETSSMALRRSASICLQMVWT